MFLIRRVEEFSLVKSLNENEVEREEYRLGNRSGRMVVDVKLRQVR